MRFGKMCYKRLYKMLRHNSIKSRLNPIKSVQMRIFCALSLIVLAGCQTAEIRNAYVDPSANIGAAEKPAAAVGAATVVNAPSSTAQENTNSSSPGDLNTTSWVELRMAPHGRLPTQTQNASATPARSVKRPLTLLAAPGEIMNPSDFPNRFLAKP